MTDDSPLKQLLDVFLKEEEARGAHDHAPPEHLTQADAARWGALDRLLTRAGAECAAKEPSVQLAPDVRTRIVGQAMRQFQLQRDAYRHHRNAIRRRKRLPLLTGFAGAAAASLAFLAITFSIGDRGFLAHRGADGSLFHADATLWANDNSGQTIELQPNGVVDGLVVLTATRDSWLFLFRVNTDVGVSAVTDAWVFRGAAEPLLTSVRLAPADLTAEAFVAVCVDGDVSGENRQKLIAFTRERLNEKHLGLLMPPGDETAGQTLHDLRAALESELSGAAVRVTYCRWTSTR
jgi:hypothetical protein